MQRRLIHYSGQVQGVGFRYAVDRAAAGRAVTGYVANLPEGRVELLVEGTVAEIEILLAEISERFAGQISDVATQDSPATGEFTGFAVRH